MYYSHHNFVTCTHELHFRLALWMLMLEHTEHTFCLIPWDICTDTPKIRLRKSEQQFPKKLWAKKKEEYTVTTNIARKQWWHMHAKREKKKEKLKSLDRSLALFKTFVKTLTEIMQEKQKCVWVSLFCMLSLHSSDSTFPCTEVCLTTIFYGIWVPYRRQFGKKLCLFFFRLFRFLQWQKKKKI